MYGFDTPVFYSFEAQAGIGYLAAVQEQALYHSLRKFFTGLDRAAFIAWKLTVIKAMSKAAAPAAINIHQLILIR